VRWSVRGVVSDRPGGREVDSFVRKRGKLEFSRPGGHMDYEGEWGVGIFVIGRS
jgi:hypothetical protein